MASLDGVIVIRGLEASLRNDAVHIGMEPDGKAGRIGASTCLFYPLAAR